MYFNLSPLRSLIAQGEGLTLDFKQTISSARKISKTVAAFANTEGGRLLIGVKDNGAIVGCELNEELYMVDSAAQLYCQPAVPFQHFEHEYKGKYVLEVFIPKSEHRPHLARTEDQKWMAFLRVEDQTQLASKVVLDLMRHQANGRGALLQFDEPERALMSFLNTQGRATLKDCVKMLRLPRPAVVQMLVKLISVGTLMVQTTASDEYYLPNPLGQPAPPRFLPVGRH